MKKTQQGFGIILLVIGLAIMAIIFGLYFTRSNNNQKSQYETGQDAIEQARQLKQQDSIQSKQLKEQMDMQNDLNAY